MTKLVQLIDALRPSDNLISCVAHYGPRFSVITNYAARMGADLILVGSQKQLGLKEMLFGCMASRIAHGTGADVLVVPRGMSKQGVSLAALDGTRREHRRIIPAQPSFKL